MALGYSVASGGTPAPIVIDPEAGAPVTVPDPALLFGAEFLRDRGDLVLRNEGAPDIRILDYFRVGAPADLLSPDGAILRGGSVARLAGPEAPGQFAQVGARTMGDPIGQVESIAGDATVQRTDGTVETLGPGSRVFADDVLQTGPDARLSVTFVDGTIFTLSPASRMVVDTLIYDPAGQDNFGSFDLIQGGFVFIAGQVAKTGGMDVTTPAATMGIKGTTVLVEIQTENGVDAAQVTLLRDPDGDVGRVELFDLSQNLIATITEANASWIISTVDGETREVAQAAGPDAADTVLIAEAVAAYQSAFGRVGQGGSFVELDNVLRGGGGGQAGSDGNDIDLDSDDADELPELAPPPDLAPREGDSFDEGRNGTLGPNAPSIVVTGLEDADEGQPISGDLAAISGAEPGTAFAVATGPSSGTVELRPDGSFVYVPVQDFNGTDDFVYSVTGPDGVTITGVVTVRVLPVNDAPEATGGTIATAEDRIVSGRVIASDVDGDTLAYRIATGAANGRVVVTADGSWAYTPDADFSGTDSFAVRVTDPSGASAVATYVVVVAELPDAPESTTSPADAAGRISEAAGAAATGRLTASDPDPGAVLTWSGSGAGTYGTFAVSPDGRWTYVAGPEVERLAEGQRVTETFTATVTDDTGRTDTQTVKITIDGAGDAPVVTSSSEDARATLAEATGAAASGQLTASDADAGAVLTWSGSAAGVYGTFSIAPDGRWTYVAGPEVESLGSGETATETFTATVSDDTGRTASQTVSILIDGANDTPVSSDGDVETIKGAAVSGTFVAADADAGDTLSFAAGAKAPADGSVVIAEDGSFTYTPNPGFQGLDSFDFVVTDGQGATSSSRVTVAVVSPTSTSGGSSVSLDITGAPGAEPAGTVISTATPVDATGVNLVIALDRSGSIGAGQWTVQINQVADALEALAARFAGAATPVDVRIVAYSTTATATPTFDLTDPALISTVRSLPFTGGTTNYASALTLTEAFFDSQPPGEANFLYFVTDGEPTESTWPTVLDRLTDAETKGYDVTIEAFGIGPSVDFDTLSVFDPSPQLLTGAGELTDAFTATPLYSADLVSLTVELVADGIDRGVIATEDAPGVVSEGLVTTLPLADIAGLADLLGTKNRISATAGYDLDGDPDTIEIELFASDLFEKQATAQTLSGTEGSDLLFGSDAGDDLNGGPGNDILIGFGGNDTIRPGAGLDTVLAGDGDDRIILSSPETSSGTGRERLDGGAGRDTLDIDFGGDVNAGLLDLVDLSGIEVIDMRNGQSNALRLTASDVLSMSDESDTDLAALLDGAVPNLRTILGDTGDNLVLEGAEKTGAVTDSSGNGFDLYSFGSGSDVLATLAVDADIAVSTQPSAT